MAKKVIRRKAAPRTRRKPHTHGLLINFILPLAIFVLLVLSFIIHRSGVLGTSTVARSTVTTYNGHLFSLTYPKNWIASTNNSINDPYIAKYLPEKLALTYISDVGSLAASLLFETNVPYSSSPKTLAELKKIALKNNTQEKVQATDTTLKGLPGLILTASNTFADAKEYYFFKGKYLYSASLILYKYPQKGNRYAATFNKSLLATFDKTVTTGWKLTPENPPPVITTYPQPTRYIPSSYPTPTRTTSGGTTTSGICAAYPPKDGYSASILTSQISTKKISYIPTGLVQSLPYANFSFIICPTALLNSAKIQPVVYSLKGTTSGFNSKAFFPEDSPANIVSTQVTKQADGSVWVTPNSDSFPTGSQLVLNFPLNAGGYIYRIFTQ